MSIGALVAQAIVDLGLPLATYLDWRPPDRSLANGPIGIQWRGGERSAAGRLRSPLRAWGNQGAA